ncbi:MAG: adenosylhomocysteinase, partial [Salinibacter sp.]
AEGHPSEVMDMSFANQFRAHLELVQRHESDDPLSDQVYDIPQEMDDEIARVKLDTMNINIDGLSEKQEHYATDYSAGT